MKPKISIVVPNYNGKSDLLALLKSVRASSYPQKLIEVIIVDNGSTDDSVKAVKKQYSARGGRVKIIQLKKNLGISPTRNIGLKLAKGRYILSCDNDVVLTKNYLTVLVDILEKNPQISLISGLVYKKKPKNKIESTGYGFNFLTGNLYDVKNNGKPIQPRQYLSGCAMLIRKKVFEKVGFFDENFYFFEDADLCFRTKKAGFQIAFTPKTKVFHGKVQTTPYHPLGKYPNWCQSLFLFLFKHSPRFLLPFSISLHLTIIPLVRKLITLDPTVKVSLIKDYQIRVTTLAKNWHRLKKSARE